MKCFQTYPTARTVARGLGLSVGCFKAACMHHEQLGREGSDVRATAKIVRSKCDSSHSRDFNARVSASTGISGWRRICVIRRCIKVQKPQLEWCYLVNGMLEIPWFISCSSHEVQSLDAQEYARSLVINQSDRSWIRNSFCKEEQNWRLVSNYFVIVLFYIRNKYFIYYFHKHQLAITLHQYYNFLVNNINVM